MYNFNQKMKKSQRGLTLIELMVALALGVIVIIGVSDGLLSMTKSSRLQTRNAELQEKADTALSYIGFSLRNALSAPCERFAEVDKLTVSSQINGNWNGDNVKTTDKVAKLFTEKGLRVGANNISKKLEGSSKTYRSDNITWVATEGRMPLVNDVTFGSKKLEINAKLPRSRITSESLYAITDCDNMDIFRAKASTNGKTLTFRSGTEIIPRYAVGSSMVASVDVSEIKVENDGRLVQKSLFKRSGGPLMEDVELIRIVFSIDNDGDGITDRYVTANQLNNLPADNKVLSADIYMMVKTGNANPAIPASYELKMPNTAADIQAGAGFMQTFTITDKVQRKVFMRSVALRNNAITL